MSDINDLIDYARNLSRHWTNPDTICSRFWEDLVTELGKVSSAFNSAMNEERLKLQNEDLKSFIKILFDEHELRLHFDRRTGRLEYRYVTPALLKLNDKESIVTGNGNVKLNTEVTSFSVKTDPELNLHPVQRSSRNIWTVPEQLSQLLIQKLVAPDFNDNRFRPTTN